MSSSQRLRSFVSSTTAGVRRGRESVKSAELGGDGNDAQFEQSFSNLAHSFLRDKAPSLLQYELGFQLLDRNQDNTKAVGIFGFKIGSQLVYAPAFFLNGELKGHELLYLKEQDQFVPMKENWINYLLNKKPNVLGQPIDKNPARLGITSPDLEQITQSPAKYGSANSVGADGIGREMVPGLAAFAHFATSSPFAEPKYANPLELGHFLKKEGAVVVKRLVAQLMDFPKLAEVFERDFDGMRVIREAVDHVRANRPVNEGVLGDKEAGLDRWSMGDRPPRRGEKPAKSNGGIGSYGHEAWKSVNGYQRTDSGSSAYIKDSASKSFKIGPDGKPTKKYVPVAHRAKGVIQDEVPVAMKSGSLEIVTLDTFDPKLNFTAEERATLFGDRVLFRDKRAEDEVATAYESGGRWTLTNPTETGIYDLLVKPGTFEKCLVIIGPHSHRRRHVFATVVRIDGEKTWINTHPSNLWTRQKSEMNGGEYASWLDSLSDVTSLPEPSRSARYVLVGPGGQGSCPFRVAENLSVEGDIKIYDVRFLDYADRSRAGDLPPLEEPRDGYGPEFADGERLHLTGRAGGRIRATGGDLYVPKGFKLLTVQADSDSAGNGGIFCCDESASEPPPIVPGTNLDLQMAIFGKTAGLKVYHSGTEVQIDGQSFSPNGALIHLVRDVGLREKQARTILRESCRNRVGRYRVKAAENPMMTGQGPSAPPFPDQQPAAMQMYGAGQTVGPMEQTLPVDMPPGDPSRQAPMPPPDPQAAGFAMQAAQTGQKEVLDASLIGSILKSVRDDTMVDRYLPDLMKGLDKLGRILFSFYWHGEKFQDRYGKQDMPELEDGLRNSFESLGDVVLALKQKSIEPYPDEGSDVDLSQIAA